MKIGGAEASAREDTGADTTIIHALMLSKVIAETPRVEVKELKRPPEMELEVQGEAVPTVLVKHELQVPIKKIIPGSRLPVMVTKVRGLVKEMEMNSVLLGRDLLDNPFLISRSIWQNNTTRQRIQMLS